MQCALTSTMPTITTTILHPQFDAVWKVGTGMSRKKWGPSDVGGRTECGMRIEFPKISVLQKDFEIVVDATIEDCVQKF